MVNRTYGPLYDKLDEAHALFKTVRTSDEKLALANYIGNVYRSIVCMGDGSVEFDRNRCFGGKKNYNKFVKKLNIYSDHVMRQFVKDKAFHKQYIQEILPDIEEEMCQLCSYAFIVEDELSEKDFFDVLYAFLDSIHLRELFDEFYKNCHVHSTIIGQYPNNLGFTLYNPINGDTDLFVRDFKFQFSTLNTLIHELGHGYDLKHFNGDVEAYNQYFYLSFYQEVLARTMERLLFRFCIRNGILKDTARDKFIDFEFVNHDFLLESYIFSLLDDAFLLSGGFVDCNSETIAKKVKKYFIEEADIKGTLEKMKTFDLPENYNYTYGDILSIFLTEEAERSGFENDLTDYFLDQRSGLFREEFLRECGFGPGNYTKLYKKEVELIKK